MGHADGEVRAGKSMSRSNTFLPVDHLDSSDDSDPDAPSPYASRGLNYYVWSREEVLRNRGKMVGSETSCCSASHSSGDTSAMQADGSTSCSCSRHTHRRPPPAAAGDDQEADLSDEFDESSDDEHDAAATLPPGSVIATGPMGPLGLRPYKTDISIEPLEGQIEPLHILRKVLLDTRCVRTIRTHRALLDRVRASLVKRERAAVLRALNRVQLFDATTVQYMRGCRQCGVGTVSVESRRYPLARILYWLCFNPLGGKPLGKVASRFVLISQCQTDGCVNPQHYTHTYRRETPLIAMPSDIMLLDTDCLGKCDTQQLFAHDLIDRLLQAPLPPELEAPAMPIGI